LLAAASLVLPRFALPRAASAASGLAGALTAPSRATAARTQQDPSLRDLGPLTGLDGSSQDLRQYLGRALLLNLWATWCAPCIAEMPSLQSLRAAQGPGGRDWLEVVAVNAGQSADQVGRFLSERRLRLPVVLDPRKEVLSRWPVRVLPATLLFDGDGRLRHRWIGERDWASGDMLREIEAALGAARGERAGT
jgi:thiol-disulfide isomerase/thioredoxin